jgi:hypothetical protein
VAFTKGSSARDGPGLICMVRTWGGGGGVGGGGGGGLGCVRMVVVAAGREDEIECRTVVYKGQHRNAKYVTILR